MVELTKQDRFRGAYAREFCAYDLGQMPLLLLPGA